MLPEDEELFAQICISLGTAAEDSEKKRTEGRLKEMAEAETRLAEQRAQERRLKEEAKAAARARNAESRRQRLTQLFNVFDEQGTGRVSTEELLKLGESWKHRGASKSSAAAQWNKEKNVAMVDQMLNEAGDDATVGLDTFIKFADPVLPAEAEPFSQLTTAMLEVSSALCALSQQQRDMFVVVPPLRTTASLQAAASPNLADPEQQRKLRLSEVFRAFDKHHTGMVHRETFLYAGREAAKLGLSRQTPRSKKVQWTKALNDVMVGQMKSTETGMIHEEEFVNGCDRVLPADPLWCADDAARALIELVIG